MSVGVGVGVHMRVVMAEEVLKMLLMRAKRGPGPRRLRACSTVVVTTNTRRIIGSECRWRCCCGRVCTYWVRMRVDVPVCVCPWRRGCGGPSTVRGERHRLRGMPREEAPQHVVLGLQHPHLHMQKSWGKDGESEQIA